MAEFSRSGAAGRTEVRFEARNETVSVIDGYCQATGKCRTEFINDLLEEWADRKLHEAIIVCRVSGVNPASPESVRK